ncbi:MAG: RNA 2',3'-cyclic phosphodiesterase [Dehalococcoidia bacterium]|nr:RNA 2',3'-cyclic phosphodiesterase [Dehalococcoidia bacterium]
MNGLRVFVAIELAAEVKAELARLQTALKRATACSIKWVSPDSMHLTLCFLGELTLGQIESVKGVMSQIGVRFSPLRLITSKPGVFPGTGQPQTIWVGLGGDLEVLSELHRHLEEDLHVVGYRPERRPFKPHLTLARVQSEASPATGRELKEAMSCLDAVLLPVDVSKLSLMKSVLSPAGAVYTCLYRTDLTGA